MKLSNRFILYIACLLFPISVFSQWEEVQTIPQQFINNYWLEVFFLPQNPNYAWICGFNGMLLRSTDRGNTWSGSQIPYAGQLESIIFLNERVGYVVSVGSSGGDVRYSRLYRTDNGGVSWRDVSPRTDVSFWGTYFINENQGVLVGGFCTDRYFFKTTDGGNSWTYQVHYDNFSINDSKLSDIVLYDNGTGYAVSSGMLWQTLNYGTSWSMITKIKANNWHEELSILKNSILVPYDYSCAGSQARGGAVFSSDFGKNWIQRDFPTACYGSFLLNDSTGWVCGLDRSIYFTKDYGKTWTPKFCGISPGAHLDDLYFLDDTTGWVVGNGVYKYKPITDTINPKISADKVQLCAGDYAIIKANLNYQNLIWNTGETTQQIVVNKPGVYYLKSSTNECDSGTSNSIEITLMPKSNLTFNNNALYEACDGDSVLVSINSPINNITWFDGDNNTSRYFNTNGWKSFAWTDTTGCIYYDSVNVNIIAMPIAALQDSFNITLCTGKKHTVISNSTPQEVDWYDADNNQLIASGANSIELDKSANIYVIAKNILGCADTSQIYSYNIDFENDYFELVSFNNLDTAYFDSLYTKDISCLDVYIKNNSSKQVTLSKLSLNGNFAFSIPQSQLPLQFAPNEIKPISICYSPTDFGKQNDTLRLIDLCSEKIIFLEGYGKIWSNSVDTKCGLSITIATRDFGNKTIFSTSYPYPNPTKSTINIDYTFEESDALGGIDKGNSANLEIPEISFELIDLLGKKVPNANFQINKSILNKNNLTETGNYKIQINTLNRGFYNLIISVGEQKIKYNIIVQ